MPDPLTQVSPSEPEAEDEDPVGKLHNLLSNKDIHCQIVELSKDKAILRAIQQVMSACMQAISPETAALPWSARHRALPIPRTIERLLRLLPVGRINALGHDLILLPAMIAYQSELDTRGPEVADMFYREWVGFFTAAIMEHQRAEVWDHNMGVAYEFTDPLMEILSQTDIDPCVPIHLVKLPFPVISLRPLAGWPLQLQRLALFKDFQVEEVLVSRLPDSNDQEVDLLGFEILWTPDIMKGRVAGSLGMYRELFIRCRRDEETPLNEKIAEALIAREQDDNPDDWTDFVTLLLKMLLYIMVPSARTIEKFERKEVLEQLRSEKNPKRKQKLEAQLKHISDRIVIGPLTLPQHDDGNLKIAEHREVRPHWRRGFFRNQRHGKGGLLSKLVFISPLLVRADRIGNDAPAPKNYLVKSAPLN